MKMKTVTTFLASLALASTLVACAGANTGTGADTSASTNVLSSNINEETGAYEVKADSADKGSGVGSLGGGITIKEGESLIISSTVSKGSLTVQLLDADGKVALEDEVTQPGDVLYGMTAGEYSVNVTANEKGTTGDLTIVAVDDDVYGDMEGDLQKTLAEMKDKVKVTTAADAAKYANLDQFVIPEEGTVLNNGPISGWKFRYEEAYVQARASVGAATIEIHKAVYAGNGDISRDEHEFAHRWTRDIDGMEVICYGNTEGRATKTTWVSGNYMYSIMALGQGDEVYEFGLDEDDIATLVRTIK